MIKEATLYRIVCYGDRTQALQIHGNLDNTRKGNYLELASISNEAKQVFLFVSNGDGSYCIRSFYNKQYVLNYYPHNAEDFFLWAEPVHPEATFQTLIDYRIEYANYGVVRIHGAAFQGISLDAKDYTEEGDYRADLHEDEPNNSDQCWLIEELSPAYSALTRWFPSKEEGLYYRIFSAQDTNKRLQVFTEEAVTSITGAISSNDPTSSCLLVMHDNHDGTHSFIRRAEDANYALTAFRPTYHGMVGGTVYDGTAMSQKWIISSSSHGGVKLFELARNLGQRLPNPK